MGLTDENASKYYDPLGVEQITEWEGPKQEPPKPPLCVSYRLLVSIIGLLCMITNFASQTSMSSALVCMIRTHNTSKTTNAHIYTDMNVTENEIGTANSEPWQFDWSLETQSWVVSALFVCYYVVQLPAGLLASRFGPQRVLVVSQILSGLGHLLTIPGTQWGLPYVYIGRIIAGLSTGCLFPSTFGLLAKWAPRNEASMLYGIAASGIELGNTLSFGLSMIACEVTFQGGWPLVFYGMGASQILLAIIIALVVTDVPSTNKYISSRETGYIERSLGRAGKEGKTRTPIKRILGSICVWAIPVSQMGTMTMYYTVITQGPIYLRDILTMSSFEINLLFAVPFIAVVPLVNMLGCFADWLVSRGTVTTTSLRKIMDFLCKLVGIVAIVGLGYVPQQEVAPVFVMFLLVAISIALSYVSYIPNAGDLSPAHASFITSIQQIGSLWSTFLIPPLVGAVVKEQTRESWQFIFYAEAVIQALTGLFFLKFASAELQPWANDNDYQIINSSDHVDVSEKETSDNIMVKQRWVQDKTRDVNHAMNYEGVDYTTKRKSGEFGANLGVGIENERTALLAGHNGVTENKMNIT